MPDKEGAIFFDWDFEYEGESFVSVLPVDVGDTIVLPNVSDIAEFGVSPPRGYDLEGWRKTGGGLYAPGASYTITEQRTNMTAQWHNPAFDLIPPVTNRLSGKSRMTYEGMNRITTNINKVRGLLVASGYTPGGSNCPKTSWTQNDIITSADWTAILSALSGACSAIDYTPETEPTSAMTYQNINNVESITVYIHEYLLAGN